MGETWGDNNGILRGGRGDLNGIGCWYPPRLHEVRPAVHPRSRLYEQGTATVDTCISVSAAVRCCRLQGQFVYTPRCQMRAALC